jgi:hypothetical protein
MAVVAACLASQIGLWILALFWPLLLFAWVFAALGAPGLVAAEASARCVLRPGRWRARWAIQLAGVGANLLLTILAFGVVARW